MENTVVTAFFDINRKDMGLDGNRRGFEEYLKYFDFWARLQNNLIIYTQSIFVQDIMAVRKKYGLEDSTQFVVIDDYCAIESEIYNKMNKIEQDGIWKQWRLNINAMSNVARYDYVMFLKYWTINDAKTRFNLSGIISWIDFGFNHLNACYAVSEEFSFYWEPELYKGKVCIFSLFDPDCTDSIKALFTQQDCILGPIFYMDADCAEQLYLIMRRVLEALLMIGIIDDDQGVLLLAYKNKPELFSVRRSTWFMPLKENGASHLTVLEKKAPKKRIITELKSIGSNIKHIICKDYSRPLVKDYIKRLLVLLGEK